MQQATILEQHIDLPPSFFDVGDMDSNHFDQASVSAPIDVEEALPVRHPVKIARAISGLTEIRLLVEKCKGKKDMFILEQTEMSPYRPARTELKRGDSPMSEKMALSTFEKKVAETYPPEVLSNGKQIPRHLSLQ